MVHGILRCCGLCKCLMLLAVHAQSLAGQRNRNNMPHTITEHLTRDGLHDDARHAAWQLWIGWSRQGLAFRLVAKCTIPPLSFTSRWIWCRSRMGTPVLAGSTSSINATAARREAASVPRTTSNTSAESRVTCMSDPWRCLNPGDTCRGSRAAQWVQ